MSDAVRQIDLIVGNDPFSTGAIVRGVAARERRPGLGRWRYTLRPDRGAVDDALRAVSAGQVDGIVVVGAPFDAGVLDPVLGRVPTVTTLGEGFAAGDGGRAVARVVLDEAAIGRVGAAHLLDAGHRRFAFCGVRGGWSEGREAAFVAALADAGFDPAGVATTRPMLGSGGACPDWPALLAAGAVERWVGSLDGPVAVMAGCDRLAAVVVDACERLGRRVPEEVAVLGVDNNDLRCEFARTPISSVDPDLHRVGLEAAAALERLMDGGPPPGRPVVVPPRGVVVRRSTEALRVDDAEVAEALAFIRDHAAGGAGVAEVLRAVPVSRSALERRFRAALGRGMGEEVRRVRLERARRMVTETALPLATVAERCGFKHLSHLSASFKRAFGTPPARYRREHPPRPGSTL